MLGRFGVSTFDRALDLDIEGETIGWGGTNDDSGVL
jgi:hypothetical protein